MMSEQQEPSMHDVISDAFTEEPEAEPAPAVADTPPPAAEPLAVADPVGEVENIPADPVPEIAEYKPPQSWGVAEREHWGKIDPAVQAQIDKREKEISNTLTTTKEARDFHGEFQTTIEPFQHFIQAEGATPMQAVGNLLQTAATLQGGSQEQKAQRIAELIGHYGIDIGTLDSLLAGEAPADPQQAALGDMLDQRLAPMAEFMQQQQNAQQQQLQAQQTTVSNEMEHFFANNEFATDVRAEMGDLMEMAGRRNQTLNLEDAYKQALAIRPDIQAVITQRQGAASAQEASAQIRQKQSAAVSVGNNPGPIGGGAAPQDMRSAIVAAMEGK